MAVDSPDVTKVRAAVRLGWLFAEVRGRARPNGPALRKAPGMVRGKWVVPLGSERSLAEREVERQFALMALGKDMEVDGPVSATLLKHLAPTPIMAVATTPVAHRGCDSHLHIGTAAVGRSALGTAEEQ